MTLEIRFTARSAPIRLIVERWRFDDLSNDDYERALAQARRLYTAIGALEVQEYGAREILGVSDLDLKVIFPYDIDDHKIGTRCRSALNQLDSRIVRHPPLYLPELLAHVWSEVHPAGARGAAVESDILRAPLRYALFAVEGVVDVIRRVQSIHEKRCATAEQLLATFNSLRHSSRIATTIAHGVPHVSGLVQEFRHELSSLRAALARGRVWDDSLLHALVRLAALSPRCCVTTLSMLGEAGVRASWWTLWSADIDARIGDYRFAVTDQTGAATAALALALFPDAPHLSIEARTAIGAVHSRRAELSGWLRRNGLPRARMGRELLFRAWWSRGLGLARRARIARDGHEVWVTY